MQSLRKAEADACWAFPLASELVRKGTCGISPASCKAQCVDAWLWVTVGTCSFYSSVCAWLASPLALWYEVEEMWHFRDLLWLYLPCVSEYQESLSALKSRSTWSLADLKVVWKAVFWGESCSTLDGWRAACFLLFLPPSAFCTLFPVLQYASAHTQATWPKSGRIFIRWFSLFLCVCLFAF